MKIPLQAAAAAVTLFASQAVYAQGTRSQYLDFQRTTDTVRLTHEVPLASALTMEARVWIDAASTSFNNLEHALWREQRNSLEDKGLSVCSQGVRMYLAGTTDVITWLGAMPTGRWCHVACQQGNGRARIWVDGELKLDVATTTNQIAASTGSSNSIGAGVHNGTQTVPGSRCRIDWLRISTCARYGAGNFTPPSECSVLADSTDGCTALLFTFDELAGSSSLQNRGYLTGTALIGASWFSGATAPVFGGVTADADGDGVPDLCECPADILVDGVVNGADLGGLLSYWGPVTSSPVSQACDLTGDGVVNGADLGLLLSFWGACP